MILTKGFQKGLLVAVALCIAIGSACSSGAGSNSSAGDKKAADAKPLAESVSPEFVASSKLLDGKCVISKDKWDAEVAKALTEINTKTGKKVIAEQIYAEAAQLAPIAAEDPKIRKVDGDKFDCTELLPMVVERMTAEPTPQPTPEGKKKSK